MLFINIVTLKNYYYKKGYTSIFEFVRVIENVWILCVCFLM